MSEIKEEQGDLDDGREQGDWVSRYGIYPWVQITLELLYLLTLLVFCVSVIVDAVSYHADTNKVTGIVYSNIIGMRFTQDIAKWIALGLVGMIGGVVFDLKWLYHSVAKGMWHRDRILWRLIVPINSAMVSVFTGLLFASGAIPFLKNETFDNLFTLLGFGFVFGYFSDSILGAMQNLARRIFGTLDSQD